MTKLSITVNRRIDTAKLREIILEKEKTTEERRYEGKRQIVKVVYNEPRPTEWGGASPSVTLKFDDNNSILLEIVIDYNRRDAWKDCAFSAEDLKQKVMHEFQNKGAFVPEEDHRKSYLAVDKRRPAVKRGVKTVKFQV